MIMATRRHGGPAGDFRGPVDTVTYCKWKDTFVVKGKPGKRKKKTTSEKVIQHNTIFGMVNRFFKSATDTINLGYQRPKVAKITPYNAAVSYHFDHAVIADSDAIGIDLSKVRFTFPIRQTQSAWNAVLSLEDGNKVTIQWELNPFPQKCTQLDDNVHFVFYDTESGVFELLPDSVERSDMSFTETSLSGWGGHDLHWWMFLKSADGKLVSETEYLGMVSIVKEDTSDSNKEDGESKIK